MKKNKNEAVFNLVDNSIPVCILTFMCLRILIESKIDTKLKLNLETITLQTRTIIKLLKYEYLYDDYHRTLIRSGMIGRQYIGDNDESYKYFFKTN